ncbi:MAG: type I DNA topoisomerase [Paludibacteraceae bacterium]|nr:type I DNA topoisomerase [Paludibacteraceae bacterium]
MSKNLVIVESPAKAKTIEKFLGDGYHVLSSQGHIRDIEGVGKNSIGIDFEHDYTPNYVIDPEKQHLLSVLRQEVKKADTVWLASDEDREGEAIAWHLQEVLNLDADKTRRIVFHEITPTAIQEAILHPRQIDYNLVNAQQARRVLDRIVGFELSPVLWRKIITGLSAGRVQSVAVRLIVEREREIENFKEQSQYRILADFIGKNNTGKEVCLRTELNHRFAKKDQVIDFLDLCQKAQFSVGSIQSKPAHRTPAPPFTTSSLQQDAARKLKFSVSKTMRIAQSLYEAGFITYMRTDSVHLSALAIETSKKEIIKEFGEKYLKSRQYKTASKGAQEAHEAIRPTYMSQHTAGHTSDEKKLYELIWKRTIACQMADAETETTRIEVTSPDIPYTFAAVGETILFDGFTKVYIQSTDDETQERGTILPKMQEGQILTYAELIGQQTYTKAPFRYTEASLVKKMEELGIGRPSTYATIIETIQTRRYVVKGNVTGQPHTVNTITIKDGLYNDRVITEAGSQDTSKLLPTDLGRMTNDFLVAQFPEILSYDFTADEEANFDKIAAGENNWVETVNTFYSKFHPLIEQIPIGKVEGRLLGKEPKTGAPVVAKISKIGPCIQIGDVDKGKPRFASLKEGQSIYTITLKEALALFDVIKNKVLFLLDGEEVVFGIGKFGPYIKYKGQFISVPEPYTIDDMTPDKVRELLRRHFEQNQPLKTFGSIQLLKGRYGLYLKDEKGSYPLPKSVALDQVTEEICQQVITNHKATKRYARKHS